MARCDYVNARIGARKARLLGKEGTRELALREGVAARAGLAAERGWPAAAKDEGVAALCRAVLSAAAAEAPRLAEWTQGRARKILDALFRLDDATALKAVLRGLVRKEAPERIVERAQPSPGIPAALVRELAALSGPEAMAAALVQAGAPLAGAVVAAVGAGKEEPRLLRMEAALDRAAIASAWDAARGGGEDAGVARRALSLYVDHANVLLLLAGVPPARAAELALVHGRMTPDDFARIAALDPGRRNEELARFLGPIRGRRHVLPEELGDPLRAEGILSEARARVMKREAREHPLSIAVVLAYLAERRRDAARIRLALLAGERGATPDLLLELLEA